jgi:large subunit ribosomal protein L9
LGMHQVRVLLHPEVSIFANVNVAQSEEEAAVQAAAKDKNESATLSDVEAALGGKADSDAPKKKAVASKIPKAKADKAADKAAEKTEESELDEVVDESELTV